MKPKKEKVYCRDCEHLVWITRNPLSGVRIHPEECELPVEDFVKDGNWN